jgi:LysR family transcriptional regulator of gallate degradation
MPPNRRTASQLSLPGLRRLRVFDAVARRGSLSAAAQELRLSQPALTRSMARLEADLGTRLFDRSPEGAFPTPAGTAFRRRTDRFFAQLVEAVAQASGEPDAERRAGLMTSAQLRALIAIWRLGSFRAAARDLNLAEPSLQRPARELEQIIARPLYRRAAVGLCANEAGAELARRLSLAQGEVRSGQEEIGRVGAGRASLRIGVLALTPRKLLAQATALLLEQDQTHKIEVLEGSYAYLARELNQGGIDVLMGALRAPPPYADLREERLFEDPYAIVCRKHHPLLAFAHVAPEDLAPFEWIFPNEGLPRRAVLNEFLARMDLPKIVQFETSCQATISALLAASDRISILSRHHIELDGNQELAFIEGLSVDHAPRYVGLTYREGWLPTPFQAAFLHEMRATCSHLGEG